MGAWLGQYAQPTPLRCRGAFHLFGTTRRADGASRLVVTSAPGVDRGAAGACLERLARAHRLVRCEAVPNAGDVGRYDETVFVELELSPRCPGDAAIARLAELGMRVPYLEAIAFIEAIGRALEAAHRVIDEESGAPIVIGGLSWANIVFATDGSPHLIGLGHNVVGWDEHGALVDPSPRLFVAPELAAGGPPSPAADAHAFVQLQRSVLAQVELPSAVQRVFGGRPEPRDAAVAELIAWSTDRVLGAPPHERADLSALREHWEREWTLFGVEPDPAGLRARIRALFP